MCAEIVKQSGHLGEALYNILFSALSKLYERHPDLEHHHTTSPIVSSKSVTVQPMILLT